ncbi:protein phosphatase 1B-like isoform X2 [Cylas formicarius]|uniref:protein phosphatase 1B-like isoform X2 n=1 Tax=Cylas formicarius TaxID=197179 RepID=UPI00295887BD|nr:protein phosphatase 1B-like isoform X2 [Cylas formicarius]
MKKLKYKINKCDTFLMNPHRIKQESKGAGNCIRYGTSRMQGWRFEMEDMLVAIHSLPKPYEDWSYFALFDGHLGKKAAAFCAENLLSIILASTSFPRDMKKAIFDSFLEIDSKIRDILDVEDECGTTAVCAFISKERLYIANCGDSRAILYSGGAPALITKDHKPYTPIEKARIIQAGGYIKKGRIDVSRTLGDFKFKGNKEISTTEQKICAEPDVFVWNRTEKDEFLVLASDGIWRHIRNTELFFYIQSRLLVSSDLDQVASQVIDTCFFKGSFDNMSVVLVAFGACSETANEAIKNDMELDLTLRRRIQDILKEKPLYFIELLKKLETTKGLPRGGGLASKCTFIESVYKNLCPEFADSIYLNTKFGHRK